MKLVGRPVAVGFAWVWLKLGDMCSLFGGIFGGCSRGVLVCYVPRLIYKFPGLVFLLVDF